MARSYREHKRRLRGAHMVAPMKVEQGAVLAGRNYLFRYSHGDDVADFCATFRRCPNPRNIGMGTDRIYRRDIYAMDSACSRTRSFRLYFEHW